MAGQREMSSGWWGVEGGEMVSLPAVYRQREMIGHEHKKSKSEGRRLSMFTILLVG